MQLRYTYRVYPTAPQRNALARTFGCVRTVYNDAVAARRKAFAAGLPFPSTAMLDKKMERKLVKAQRELSRKQKGSADRAKARIRLALVHERIKDRRDDWLHKQVGTIIAENQSVYVEDLNVKGLSRGRAAKSIADAAMGRFLVLLESKAARAGRTFRKVDRFYPSTQLCPVCGALTGRRGWKVYRSARGRVGAGHFMTGMPTLRSTSGAKASVL